MTRHELIRLLEQSFIDYPQVPLVAEVMVQDSIGNPCFLGHLKVVIVAGYPTVILI